MDFLKFFQKSARPRPRSGSVLGIDIGTTSIKAVEVVYGSGMPQLVNYGLLESRGSILRANTAFQTSTLKMFDREVGEFLGLLLQNMKPRTTLAVASMPIFSAFTTVLSFPEMAPADLANAVNFQARQVVPLPLSEVALDWSVVGQYKDEKGFSYQQVLLISVPQAEIRKYQAMFKAAGLTLQSLEVESVSLSRLLVGTDPTPTYVIDIGSRSTGIIIADKGNIVFSTQTDFAGSSLTQALASSLAINPLRAEELKKERGIVGTGPNYELSTIMLPFVDAILNEVKRADFSYRSQFPQAPKIERAILTGGGANLLGIEKYAAAQLGIPVVKAAPLGRFAYPALIEPLAPELSPMLSTALGLTLRTS